MTYIPPHDDATGHDDTHDDYADDTAIGTLPDDASTYSSSSSASDDTLSDDDSSVDDEPLVDNEAIPPHVVDDNIITDDNSTSSHDHSADDDSDDDDLSYDDSADVDAESNTSSIAGISKPDTSDTSDVDETPASVPPTTTPPISALRSADTLGDTATDTANTTNSRPKRSESATQRNSYVPDFKGKSYEVQFLQHTKQRSKPKPVIDDYYRASVNVMFTQMSAKKGIKTFGESAIAAMFKEYNQLNDMNVFGSVNPDTLTRDQKYKALHAINLIKEKRCGRIKGRTCADGRPQRAYVPREEATSPTVSMEALMATLVIDAKEQRDVAIFDVPGAYLHADMPDDKFVLLKLEGEFVNIMCDVNPNYIPFVRTEKGKKVLYLQLLKALYGCIESALLWYNCYTNSLNKLGFKINETDKCIANKMINGKQCTIVWYVDDNKLSHVDKNVVSDVIKSVEDFYGPLVTTRGRKHTFLGMSIEFCKNGSVKIGMREHIKEAIDVFGEDVSTKVSSPANLGLNIVDETSPELNMEQQDLFHSIVAKLLWVMKRGRPDIETTIAFLCTRVAAPTEQDWKKLRRLLQFLNQTIDDVRVVAADDLSSLFTWIDAAYAVHPNMRSHTGGTMSMGLGVLHCKSSKQKLNTKSSTEAEVVGTSDYVPYNIHMVMFMKHQGYDLKTNILYQDNQSAIRMETNGRNSCTGNSRHVDIRYFFVKDRVDKKEIQIMYCPTQQMLADYFTKPLQGKLFHNMRRVIMGWDHISILKTYLSSTSKKRVGISVDEDKINTTKNEEKLPRQNMNHATYAQVLTNTLPMTAPMTAKQNSPHNNMNK